MTRSTPSPPRRGKTRGWHAACGGRSSGDSSVLWGAHSAAPLLVSGGEVGADRPGTGLSAGSPGLSREPGSKGSWIVQWRGAEGRILRLFSVGRQQPTGGGSLRLLPPSALHGPLFYMVRRPRSAASPRLQRDFRQRVQREWVSRCTDRPLSLPSKSLNRPCRPRPHLQQRRGSNRILCRLALLRAETICRRCRRHFLGRRLPRLPIPVAQPRFIGHRLPWIPSQVLQSPSPRPQPQPQPLPQSSQHMRHSQRRCYHHPRRLFICATTSTSTRTITAAAAAAVPGTITAASTQLQPS